ncbi:MAG: 2OG-Fe(II) oxygenase [Sphingomicrobium sp.]
MSRPFDHSAGDTAARLRAAPAVQRVPSTRLDLFVCREFLGLPTCAALIERIDGRRRPSEIADDIGVADFRTSETCDLNPLAPEVAIVEEQLTNLLGIPLAFGEKLQGQRYAAGQEFKPHTDTFEPDGAAFFEHCADTGNRTWTAMIYLNVPQEGGATRFKRIGKTIQPEIGKLVVWNNLFPDGRPNPDTLHQGMKVRCGTKYVITKWYRAARSG